MTFWSLFKNPFARKIQNPSNPITAAAIMAAIGAQVGSGYDTTPESGALTFLPVFAAERLISETIASIPLVTYKRLDDDADGRTRENNVPQYRILHDYPNESQTPFAFWDAVVKLAIRHGNAYVYIERNNANVPVNLRILDSLKMKVTFGAGGKMFEYDQGEYTIDGADVIHIMGFSNDGLIGIPIARYAERAIMLGMAAEASALKLFEQGSITPTAIELTAPPTKEQYAQLVQTFQATHGGVMNHHKPLIIPGGKLNSGTSNLDQMQFLELRRWQLLEICRLFRIPPHMLGDLERATFSNIEQQSREFIQNAIRPWLTKIEQEINFKLFSPTQQKTYFAAFMLDDLLRGDTATRYGAYNIGLQAGFLKVNEVRRWENLPPEDGGDVLRTPLNMAPAGGASKTDPNEPAEDPAAAKVTNESEGGSKNGGA